MCCVCVVYSTSHFGNEWELFVSWSKRSTEQSKNKHDDGEGSGGAVVMATAMMVAVMRSYDMQYKINK